METGAGRETRQVRWRMHFLILPSSILVAPSETTFTTCMNERGIRLGICPVNMDYWADMYNLYAALLVELVALQLFEAAANHT